ncbi:hypothetical protein HMPREF0083_02990 [Aneurinibacillus aneurinilyticus ATCC 12856]|jgi:hypothetical protein|uniref:Uncharacterized protein n=1 Tax=Aneurinibacillus aneurinilyticus ATCC 12856 TaxID=649747 RepID=U1X1S6_ANEAE|nr:hypothetical protein HMPREF0083_02990 [Aneurinibacillus aneurinilyticus ATCC 12856]
MILDYVSVSSVVSAAVDVSAVAVVSAVVDVLAAVDVFIIAVVVFAPNKKHGCLRRKAPT